MAGVLGSHTDASCNTHNALRNVSEYACGVSFEFKHDGFDGFKDGYAVVALQQCCAAANVTLMRIPGNTGCEIQYCEVPAVLTAYTQTIEYAYATGTGTAAKTPAPSVTQDVRWGPPDRVENCMAFVDQGDLPDDVASGISRAGNWCAVRNYDDESSEQGTAVTAAPAPAAWTFAAASPAENYLTKLSTPSAATTTSTRSSDGARNSIGRPKSWGMVYLGLLVLVRGVFI
jgi:hypothetical protein